MPDVAAGAVPSLEEGSAVFAASSENNATNAKICSESDMFGIRPGERILFDCTYASVAVAYEDARIHYQSQGFELGRRDSIGPSSRRTRFYYSSPTFARAQTH